MLHGGEGLVGVYVSPPYRGSGTADDLLAVVIRWAREEARAGRVRLFVRRGNRRAAGFYRRPGFEATGIAAGDEDEMVIGVSAAHEDETATETTPSDRN
ncbi:GNAT family N-acetyltransferase [Actinoplanes sp. NPDC049596]|uniref:GNAT family N-acetyltransferase n=1 Tax=unclassified Actinoplanes TaxID=2626549 RepID=UPI0034328279